MKIIDFENDDMAKTNMSSLQGYIETTYEELVTALGEPTFTESELDKSTVQWDLTVIVKRPYDEDHDYVVATIYDWKTAETPTEPYKWHIGGFDNDAVDVVQQLLK